MSNVGSDPGLSVGSYHLRGVVNRPRTDVSSGVIMSTEGRGKTAVWAKVLAAIVLLVLIPLVIYFMVSFQGSGAFPW